MTKKKYPELTKEEALKLAWKNRKDYKGYDKTKGSMFNTWRGIINTDRGRKIGFPEEWLEYSVFENEVGEGWERGKVLIRKDKNLPYSKDNVEWADKGMECMGKLTKLEYNGETKTLLEWCAQYNINYNGMRQRYFRHKKEYTAEEIIFGKSMVNAKKKSITDINEIDEKQRKMDKCSKMVSSYRCKDKKYGYTTDIDRFWLYDKIKDGRCFYCGDTKHLGLDRIDNNKGHTKDNCVVCCYDCNCARNRNFTFEEMIELGKTISKIKSNRK